MSLISHQSNQIRNLVGFVNFSHFIQSKIELLGFAVQQSFMKELFLTGKNHTFHIFLVFKQSDSTS